MKQSLKLVIDRHTLACLLMGMNELAAVNKQGRINPVTFDALDYEAHCVYLSLIEFFEKLQQKERYAETFKLKIPPSLAMAMRRLVEISIPADAWTNAKLVEIADLLDRYIAEIVLLLNIMIIHQWHPLPGPNNLIHG